jgi:hypothetical protein
MDQLPPGIIYERQLKMTKHPTLKSVRLGRLVTDYGAQFFCDALARFITKFNNPLFTSRQIESESAHITFAFHAVPVFHRIKFTTQDPYTALGPLDSVVDSIHVQPRKVLNNGEDVPARFDTALVNDSTGGLIGVDGK